jgi:hypothetical protein
MAVGFLAPTHVPIRVHLSNYRASLASVCMVSVHLFRNAPTGATPKGRSAEGPE